MPISDQPWIPAVLMALPLVGFALACVLSSRFPDHRRRLIAISLGLVALAALTPVLSAIVRFPPSGSWEAWSWAGVLEKLSFFFLTLPCWSAMAIFHLLPSVWRIPKAILSILAGYVAVAPTIFLLLVTVCDLYDNCL